MVALLLATVVVGAGVVVFATVRLVKLLRRDVYEFAEHCDDTLDAFGFQRAQLVTGDVPYVDSGHPKDCDRVCCSEERLTERVQAFPWDTYEQELTW